MSRKGNTLTRSTWSTYSRYYRSSQAADNIHGSILWFKNTLLFHDRVLPATVGTESWESTTAPKLCSFPPTTEEFEQNVRRAHYQVAQWYNALSGNPSPFSAVDYGWEADSTNKCLIPRTMKDGVPYAPEYILKLVKWDV